MPKILNVITRPDDFAREVIRGEEREGDVEVFDLTAGNPDYEALLEKIFEADAVHVW